MNKSALFGIVCLIGSAWALGAQAQNPPPSGAGQPPRQRTGVAVQFRPRDGKHLVVAGIARHAVFSPGLSGLACSFVEAALTASNDALKIAALQ